MARHYVSPNRNAVPDSPTALAEYLASDRGMSELYGPGGTAQNFAAFNRAYARAVSQRDPDLGAQLRDQLGVLPPGVQRAVAGRARPGNAIECLYQPGAPGAKLDGLFDGAGDFVRAIRRKDPRLGQVREVQNSFGSEIPDAGGLLVPDDIYQDLVLASLQAAIVRPRAINIPMSTLRVGVPMIDDTTHASTIMGGFTAYWSEENSSITESQASYGRIMLDAKALKALGSAPNELMQDALAFGTYLRTVLPRAMAWWEDHALTAGTGVAEPLGYLYSPCAISVTRATSSHIKHADVIGMLTRMLPASLPGCVWQCSPDAFTELCNVYLLVGTVPTSAAASPPNWLEFDGTMWRLLGLPLYVTEHVPALGTKGDLSLAALDMYLLGTRQLMQLDVSPHFKFSTDVSSIRVRTRLDGRMWPQSSLTPANSSQTVSAVVVLN